MNQVLANRSSIKEILYYMLPDLSPLGPSIFRRVLGLLHCYPTCPQGNPEFSGFDQAHGLAAYADFTSAAGEKRKKVSTMVRILNFSTVASWSWTKSIAQIWLHLVDSVQSSRKCADKVNAILR